MSGWGKIAIPLSLYAHALKACEALFIPYPRPKYYALLSSKREITIAPPLHINRPDPQQLRADRFAAVSPLFLPSPSGHDEDNSIGN